MGTAESDQEQLRSLIQEGIRHLRRGKVSAALKSWDRAVALDEQNETALSYLDYIKKNRIRIAVHMGRNPPEDDKRIIFPDEWPAPPAGLCDPVPAAGDDTADEKYGATGGAAADDAATDDAPYAEMEITGSHGAITRKAAKPSAAVTDADAAADAPAAPAEPPPAPESKAPEAGETTPPQAEAPRVDSDPAYEAMEISVEVEAVSRPGPSRRSPEIVDSPEGGVDAPPAEDTTEPLDIERIAGALDQELLGEDDESDPPVSPSPDSQKPISSDEMAANPRAQAELMMRGLAGRNISPSTTLAGVGPKMLFADFKDPDLAGDAPPLDFGSPPADAGEARAAIDEREDAPTHAASADAAPPTIRLDKPRDFSQEEASLPDDIPSQAEPGSPNGPLIQPMPLSTGDSPAESAAPAGTPDPEPPQDRDEQTEISEELEAILHPERGLALAQRLCDTGEFERSVNLAEQLQSRYPDLVGIQELIASNRRVLEQKLLDSLGDLADIAVPKPQGADLSAMDLDPRTAFLFSRIDGTMSVEDLIDISGMTRFETARILVRLKELGLLELEPA